MRCAPRKSDNRPKSGVYGVRSAISHFAIIHCAFLQKCVDVSLDSEESEVGATHLRSQATPPFKMLNERSLSGGGDVWEENQVHRDLADCCDGEATRMLAARCRQG
jgi:hypothetical protein